MAARKYPDLRTRLEARIQRIPSGCWLWTGTKLTTGYGQIVNHRKCFKVHRVAYELFVGPIPDGMQIDHICHVRLCVNPAHLRLATNKQNGENRLVPNPLRGASLKADGRWVARVTHNGHEYHGGSFRTAEEAVEGARLLRIKLFTHNDSDRRAAS